MRRRRADTWPRPLAWQLTRPPGTFEKTGWVGTRAGKRIAHRRQGRRGRSLLTACLVDKDWSMMRLSLTRRSAAADGRSVRVVGLGGLSVPREVVRFAHATKENGSGIKGGETGEAEGRMIQLWRV